MPNPFKVGDFVSFVNSSSIPAKGYYICGISHDYCGIDMGSDFNGHNLGGRLTTNTGYWYDYRSLVHFSSNHNKMVVCSCCGNKAQKATVTKGTNGKYVCGQCIETKGYYTKNNSVYKKHKAHNKTYGFEFECVPYSEADKASLLDGRYGFIPTHDGSLPSDGVEFKTPTYQSLNGFKAMLRTCSKYADFENIQCGQHINIGDTKYINENSMSLIRIYASQIFDSLQTYMNDNEAATVAVCGRYFTFYAGRTGNYLGHGSWINLEHNNRIEFRISKFNTPEQYFWLTCMWTEILDCIITHFIKKYGHNNCKLAEKTGLKIVKIFKKYENGNANCQRKERNKKVA